MKLHIFPFLLIIALVHAEGPDFVLELFRHGARSAGKTKYFQNWDDLGVSELTSVGMRQQYILGKALRQKYPDLLFLYNPNKLYVFATGKERTIMSAAAQLQGIYEGTGPEIPSDISNDLTLPLFNNSIIDQINLKVNVTNAAVGGFQPIPIHSTEPQFDYLLQSYLRCPNLDRYYQKHLNDDKVKKMFGEMKEVVEFYKTKGITLATVKDIKDLADAAIAAKFYGKELPGGISTDSQTFKDLEFVYNWYETYPVFVETIQKQTFAAPMFSDLIDYLDGIRDGSSKTRVVLWSGHETALFTLLNSFNLTNSDCLEANWRAQRNNKDIQYPKCIYPGYSANLIFEFYNKTADPYVVFRYSDREISICGENKNCTLEEFRTLINKATGNNKLKGYYKICGVPEAAQLGNLNTIPNEKMYPKELVFAMGGIIAALLIIVAVLLAKRYQTSRQSVAKAGKSLLRDSAVEEEL